MDRVCISSAKGDIMRDLQISDQMMGWIFGIFALGYALFQVPSGWFADRFGPRKALTVVVSFWSTFTMLTGAAFNALSMLVLRFIFGVGEAGAFPGATRAFYRWLPVKERGIAQGIKTHARKRPRKGILAFISIANARPRITSTGTETKINNRVNLNACRKPESLNRCRKLLKKTTRLSMLLKAIYENSLSKLEPRRTPFCCHIGIFKNLTSHCCCRYIHGGLLICASAILI